MNTPSTIAIDSMGGDHGPRVVVPAAVDSLHKHQDLSLILVGDEGAIRSHLPAQAPLNRLTIRHCTEVVEMHESPVKAMRNKRDSSMRIAIDLVKSGQAGACVSAGNTGALMAIAKFVLKTIEGIDRPAIITAVPSMTAHTHVLDLGANVDCTAEHLYQFAVMGYELVRAVEDIDRPRVGLLNIGEEEIKGSDQVKTAAKLLSNSHINFIGYVEGNDLFSGKCDIVVTDGFVGNVALKVSEGVAKMLGQSIKSGFKQNWLTKLAGLAAYPVLKGFSKRYDPRQYNGASLVGLRGIVVKSHGNADQFAFSNAINIARLEIEKSVPARIGAQITQIVQARGTA